MKTTRFFLAVFFIFLYNIVFSQINTSVYGGVLDFPGLAIEYVYNNTYSIDYGISYRSKRRPVAFEDGNSYYIYTNFMQTICLKKQKAHKNNLFFYGLYLRYWRVYDYIETHNLSLDQKIDAEKNSTKISDKIHKISLGVTSGYQLFLAESFFIGCTGGIGLSPKNWYWEEVTDYGKPPYMRKVGSNEFIGYLNHLSFIGRISFGYRFLASEK